MDRSVKVELLTRRKLHMVRTALHQHGCGLQLLSVTESEHTGPHLQGGYLTTQAVDVKLVPSLLLSRSAPLLLQRCLEGLYLSCTEDRKQLSDARDDEASNGLLGTLG